MAGPDMRFWQERFNNNDTPWDRGEASPQLRAWLDAGVLQPCRILLPGCGTGHEAALLAARGFDVTAIDYAPAAVARTRARLAEAKLDANIVEADALTWQPDSAFDAIYEQTCLCAIHPDLWTAYAAQLHRWLKRGGTLYALFAQIVRPGAATGFVEGPPYHCDINGMRALFPASAWQWPKPPYARIDHPHIGNLYELAAPLVRR